MGKPNFSFQKRQKELAKKKKNEEKRQRKLEKNTVAPETPIPSEDQQDPAGATGADSIPNDQN